MDSHYLTSYQQDYYWRELEHENEDTRNDYERRLVWSKCPWRYFPKTGQTVFTRQYQPWGILPRWPHLFTIDEIHEHPRDKMHKKEYCESKALDDVRTDDPTSAYYEEYSRRVPFRSTLPPIEKDGPQFLHQSNDVCQRSFTAPIWYRPGWEKIPGKDQDKTDCSHKPRYPFEYPTWESVYRYDYKWDLQTN